MVIASRREVVKTSIGRVGQTTDLSLPSNRYHEPHTVEHSANRSVSDVTLCCTLAQVEGTAYLHECAALGCHRLHCRALLVSLATCQRSHESLASASFVVLTIGYNRTHDTR